MRILFLTHRVPYPLDKGDRIRSYNIIKFLARHHSIALMSVDHEPIHPRSREALQQFCESVEFVRINSRLGKLRSGLHLFTQSPLTLAAFYSRKFHDAVRAKLRSTQFDLVYIYSSSMAQYVIDGNPEAHRRSHNEGHEDLENLTTKYTEDTKLLSNTNSELRALHALGGQKSESVSLISEAQRRSHHEGHEDLENLTTEHTKDTKVLNNINSELRALRDLRGKDSFELSELCASSVKPNPEAVGDIPKIMDFIDVDSQKWFDYAARARQPMKWIYAREGTTLRAYEKTIGSRCVLSLFTSESELKIFKEFAPDTAALALPNGVDATLERNPTYRQNKLVFVGSMDYLPNVDAMVHFTGEILPLIQKEIPDVELFIVGRNPSERIKALGRLKGVTVTGDVEDVGTYLQQAAASVVPLRIARGVQNKVLEAMAHGVPVIATSAALDGIAAEPEKDVLVADNAGDFARKTITVLKDKSLRQQLAANALKLVQQEYRWETTLQPLERAISSIAPNPKAQKSQAFQDLRDLRALRGEDIASDSPFVSFVIPAKNEARIIGQCLDAINNLDYDPERRECIVVDNGSVDDTVNIAQQKGAKVLSMPKGTISALRNFGANEAKGDYLAFIDADCIIGKGWLKSALPHFADPSVGCVGSRPGIPEEAPWVEQAWNQQTERKHQVEEADWLGSANVLVRRSAFLDIQGFNESLITCEDVDFCYRLKSQYKIISDSKISSIHFSEVKTVSDFFQKEHWRGQSNFQGLRLHGFVWQETPSLLLPLYYLFALVSLAAGLFFLARGYYLPVAINIAAMVLPSILLALRTSLRRGDSRWLVQLIVLYFVYSLARAAAIVSVKRADQDRELFPVNISR